MTHDELLAKLSIPIIFKAGIQETDIVNVDLLVKRNQALRAVVELHKPSSNEWDTIPRCAKCRYSDGDLYPYPCWTIQAIEGQLR